MKNQSIYEIKVFNSNHNEVFSHHYLSSDYTEEEVKNEFKNMVLESCFYEDDTPWLVNFKPDTENGNILCGFIKYQWYYMEFSLTKYEPGEFFSKEKSENWLGTDNFEINTIDMKLKTRYELNDTFEKLLIDKPPMESTKQGDVSNDSIIPGRAVLLNKFHDPALSECIWVQQGDQVYGSSHGEEFYITERMKYAIIDTNGYDLVKVRNDAGIEDWYSVECFNGKVIKARSEV